MQAIITNLQLQIDRNNVYKPMHEGRVMLNFEPEDITAEVDK